MAIREFNDQGQVNKTTIMTRILQLVHELCIKGIHVTKRDMFYTDVKLFEVRSRPVLPCSRGAVTPDSPVWLPPGEQDQKKSDAVLDDVSCMLGCTRSSLNGAPQPDSGESAVTHLTPPATPLFTTCAVVASEKGVVVGRLTFREDGDLIDCSKARARLSVCCGVLA
jgi:meiotic recombination protein SPO11